MVIHDYNTHSLSSLSLKNPQSKRPPVHGQQQQLSKQNRREGRPARGLDRSHPLASSIVSMTNLEDSTNALIVPRDHSSFIGSIRNNGPRRRGAQEATGPVLTPDDLLAQINRDNDVELGTTLWKVLRNDTYAKDNELAEFCVSPKLARHVLNVGDVIKFGRVNFKVCALRCGDRIKDECQGGYYLLEKRQQAKDDKEMLEEL